MALLCHTLLCVASSADSTAYKPVCLAQQHKALIKIYAALLAGPHRGNP